MGRPRANRASFLLAAGLLTLGMLFASDVIVETVVDAPTEALGLALLAISSISMAGAVITTMDQRKDGAS